MCVGGTWKVSFFSVRKRRRTYNPGSAISKESVSIGRRATHDRNSHKLTKIHRQTIIPKGARDIFSTPHIKNDQNGTLTGALWSQDDLQENKFSPPIFSIFNHLVLETPPAAVYDIPIPAPPLGYTRKTWTKNWYTSDLRSKTGKIYKASARWMIMGQNRSC